MEEQRLGSNAGEAMFGSSGTGAMTESNQSDGMNCNVGEQCLGEAVVEQ